MPIPLAASCSLSVIYLLCVMGFLLFYLFIYFSVAIFMSCLCPFVLSVCLGVHWSSVVM